MIKSRHYPLAIWFFDGFFRLRMKLAFTRLIIHGKFHDAGKPVLLLQNHFSWWDGYWSYFLSKTFFNRKFHVMMLEEQLAKRIFINWCGAFSVRRKSRSAIESLNYAADLLDQPGNLVCLYPQGEIQSQHVKPIRFERGAAWLLKNKNCPIDIYFCCCLLDYKNKPKPVVNMYLKNYAGSSETADLELAYNTFHAECIKRQDD